MISADEFLFGLGEIEGGAIGFGMDADQEHCECQGLGEDVPGGDEVAPTVGLALDDGVKVERAVHQDDAEDGQAEGDFIGDHVGGGAQAAEEGIFVVTGPAADDDAIDGQGEDSQDV